MTLFEMLESLGDKLGILVKVEGTAAHPASKIKTKSVTLAELAAEIHAEEVRSLAELPAELSVPFEKIYETAGIRVPMHGWTIERLKELLQTDVFRNLDRVAAQARLVGMLAEEKVMAEDLVKEAMSRDQAIDAFERFARKKMEDRLATRERQIAELETRIDELQKESQRLRELAVSEDEQWREWRRKKRTQEKELARTISYLIDREVITTDHEE